MKFGKIILFLLLATVLFTAAGCAGKTVPAARESAAPAAAKVSDIIPSEYAYTLTVTINPEAKLYLDGADCIVGISYLNEDAKTAYGELTLVGSALDEGLNAMVDSAIEKDFLQGDSPVSIELSEVKDAAAADPQKLEDLKVSVGDHIAAQEALNWTAAVRTGVAEAAAQVLETAAEAQSAQAGQPAAETAEEAPEEVAEEEPAAEFCARCNGTGNDCTECGGIGIVNCKRCNNGFETCGTCHGSGVQRCNGCKGAGTDPGYGSPCGYCGGTGSTTCEQCGGAGGWDDCSWCHGALQHVCPVCEGSQICPDCGGTGLK